jgi:hypothetical protein
MTRPQQKIDMKDNEINEFSFEEVQYGDFETRLVSGSRFTDSFAKKRCDYARTALVAWHPPGTHIPRYRWEHREIWFYTNNETQVLEIAIQSPQSMSDKRPRFHLHRVDSNESKWIRRVEHKQQATDHWNGLGEITENAPPHTRFMRLHLSLPASNIRTSFKLFVYAKDRDFINKSINCDPLVGNDPPRDVDFA